jgi:predicted nucleotidyltransferase
MEREEVLREIVAVVRRRLPDEEFRVLLFGSWARGDAQERSDIDVGILGPRAVDDMILLRIKGEIRAIPTLRRIDVVDLNKTDESFREEVLSYAKSL